MAGEILQYFWCACLFVCLGEILKDVLGRGIKQWESDVLEIFWEARVEVVCGCHDVSDPRSVESLAIVGHSDAPLEDTYLLVMTLRLIIEHECF